MRIKAEITVTALLYYGRDYYYLLVGSVVILLLASISFWSDLPLISITLLPLFPIIVCLGIVLPSSLLPIGT